MITFEERLRDSLSHAYNIDSELGGGGMSRVFVATDKSLGRKVVIKLLSPELTAGVNRERFRREIQVAAQLQHPHIVTLLSAGEDGEIVYYTMPFIEGESLKSAVELHGPMAVKDVVRVLYDVVDALAYAHARGVVHRDIKPANILRSGAHSLVTDFGVAKALNAAMPSSAMTSTGMAIGTPAYMAPEQLAGDPAADHRIDIYAVGLLAYELLAGASPFAGISPQAVMAALLTRDPKPLTEIRKDVPKRLSAIIAQCLAKDPEERPASADALLTMLDMVATASGEIRTREHKVPFALAPDTRSKITEVKKAEKTPTVVPTYTDEEEPPRRKGMLVGGLIALAIAAAIAIGVFMNSRGGPQQPTASTVEPPPTLAAQPKPGAPAANSKTVVAPPVMSKSDSMAIVAAVTKRLTDAATAAAKKTGGTAVNTDSLKKKVQQAMADSMAKAKTAAAAAAVAAAPPAAPPAAAPAPAAPATPGAPAFSGRRRLAIAEPADVKEQPAINSFARALSNAVRAALNKDSFDPVDQDEVRSAFTSQGRDEATKTLKPDALVTQVYSGTGDTVKVTITVRDVKGTSTYGTRMISARVMPAYPQYFLKPVVQAVLRQLEDLQKAPSIYGR